MPGFNGTGPMGQGPMTGQGLGPCGRGMAWGRGRGWGGRFFYGQGQNRAYGVEELENEKKLLSEEMQSIDQQIASLKKGK
ncbi:MAG TPA: DUF5320 domain-containing protein [bacterium]|nr:DUF5320 domain-containing protein [bacterium]HNS33807.1 DUF5320 domain-containing protein [bacterium]HNZ73350.1 DUF5320 domain-containing protein [bacterium]HOH66978.1 DUF5320 domain-containing protein [bacterium]HQA63653.1 DUF5320 domain-containing protein [bacterium]